MEEILIAVKNKEIDEDSALDIMLEFIEKSKEIKVKNILKLLSKNLLSLENASKMINAMSNLNDSKYIIIISIFYFPSINYFTASLLILSTCLYKFECSLFTQVLFIKNIFFCITIIFQGF